MKLQVKLPANLRFAAVIAGCMLTGAAGAAYYRADARATAVPPEVPLFMQAAIEAPTPVAWPPNRSVAFYEEMFALLTTTATPRTTNTRGTALDTAPERVSIPGAGEPPRANDLIVIRDRFGRPIRVERGDRRLAGPQGYPPPYGPYGSPYAPYGPYRR